MPIHVALHHRTRYSFDQPIILSPHIVRLRPCPHSRTPIVAYSLKIAPANHFLNWQQDPYSNYLARLVFPDPTHELDVTVDLVAELTAINPFDFFIDEYAEKYPFPYEKDLLKELAPYLEALPLETHLAKFVEQARIACARPGRRVIDVLVEVNQLVQRTLKYDIRMEPGVQSPEETLAKRHGSCRDFTWLMVQTLRHLGFAARFVSGYSVQLVADVKALDGPSGVAKDITDLHAWTEVYLPGAGWIGFDSTSGLMCGEGHIPLACTAEPGSAAPISGGFSWLAKEGKDTFSFEMSVTRIHEDPRVTKPYTEEQWKQIEALGHLVDDRLIAGDVRLTMGGEPTFVSVDDMDGAEWNTAAQGPNKRRLAGQLLGKLHKRFAPGGVLHFAQGKWYPGESLPRWALGCYWRKDGVPVWQDPKLLSDGITPGKATDKDASVFAHELAARLGKFVSAEHLHPAYEDAFYYIWKERRLPVNVDPFENRLDREEDRTRFAKIFEQGLDKIIGYTLPLRPAGAAGDGVWQSGAWFFRAERMYLIPGDSPMGLRLPLDSIPWVAKKDAPQILPRDPATPVPPLPDFRQLHFRTPAETQEPTGYRAQKPLAPSTGLGRFVENAGTAPIAGKSAPNIIRTALCIEPRNGIIHVFMPPVDFIEDYLDLIARIEQTAAALKTPVVIEGYTPPHDPRIEQLKVTPDPGVIEVNVHPIKTWQQAVDVAAGLYDDAFHSRLGTEKFMLDGRHTGTGGGNHIVVGGATPKDSPFLRRPDLLSSLISYWHNHPSLSYLFSGMFIGPTSQAPRADEGRADSVYELETAMRQLPSPAGVTPPEHFPWLVDRIFRNLLVDLTGNTHRAEFCIDKLFSPDSSSGRLGLVEFRGFEMPPHARMSLTQQLLLRSLIARFWEKPYTTPLVRWKTELHDRFLLPHFVSADFADVLTESAQSGFPLKKDWFAPHFEFRFPVHGFIDLPHSGGIRLELRQAIEPWYVLGEEPAGGGTVRFVDSSVERLQVFVNGMINPRHSVGVNGFRVPLHSTGINGQYVAGVRYRAWQPPSCLHPTIPSHAPLVFDLVDTWNNQAVGGCTYNVAHPGGLSHEDFPVNALAAESRRNARFLKFGHTPGTVTLKEIPLSPEFPFTLDLRRA